MALAKDPGLHPAHRGAHDQLEVIHAKVFGEQAVLCLDHVRVAVLRKSGPEPITRLRGFPVPDPIGQHDEILVGVERLPRAKQLAGELRPQELRAGTARAMADPHRVANHALRVLARLAERAVVQAKLGKRRAVGELEVADHEVALGGRRVIGSVGSERKPRDGDDQQRGFEHE
jgi:hypothetical protein